MLDLSVMQQNRNALLESKHKHSMQSLSLYNHVFNSHNHFGEMGIHLLFATLFLPLLLFQSQGAITERLRSFSMHDLTAIQGDEPLGQRHYQTLPEARKRGKSATNESLGWYLTKQSVFAA